jgi:hypothetical protein
LIPLAAIPETLIPLGRSSYRAHLGPTAILSLPQGRLDITRDAEAIVLASEKHGTLSLSADSEDRLLIHAEVPASGRYSGHITIEQMMLVFSAGSGHRLTFTFDRDRVEVRFQGFGAFDSMKLYLRRDEHPRI